MDNQYCGYVSIIGKPNVGKSSIINAILNKKVSITSRKSQTTRNNIIGFKTKKNKQMILIDTPGMHIKSQKTMNKILNKSAQSIIEDADIIFVLDNGSLVEFGNHSDLMKKKKKYSAMVKAQKTNID